MTTFSVGDRVRLVADAPAYRSDGRVFPSGAAESGVGRGSHATVLREPDDDGDYGVRWDQVEYFDATSYNSVDPALLALATAAVADDLVSARVAAEFTTRKVRQLAAYAATCLASLDAEIASATGDVPSTEAEFFQNLLKQFNAGHGVDELEDIEKELEK